MFRKALILISVLGIVSGALVGCGSPAQLTQPGEPAEQQTLLLATTTSTENSGLLAYLLLDFEAEYGVKVDVVAVGTGQALKMGEEGNADVDVRFLAPGDAKGNGSNGSGQEEGVEEDNIGPGLVEGDVSDHEGKAQ